jgi:hypothetical protein
MQVSTTLVSAEAKPTQRGTIYKFKEASGGWLATNDLALANKAKALLNQPLLADINEVVSQKINEHTGRPYVNRYLNSVEVGATQGGFTATTTNGFSASFNTGDVEVTITAKDRSIWAQSASKVAAHLLTFFPDGERTLPTFDNLVQREIEKYEAAFKGAPAAFAAAGIAATEVAPPHSDDDIPF